MSEAMEDPVKGPVKDPAYVAAQTGTVIHQIAGVPKR